MSSVHAAVLVLLLFLLGGCQPRVLHANFNSDTAGAVPSPTQLQGTDAVDAGAGTVRVVNPPQGASTNWVEIRHPNANSPQTALQGKFQPFHGEGSYGVLAVMFMPAGSGVATLQFEPAQNGPGDYLNFLHLDFLPNNTIRVDDGQATFGTFPRDKFFTISVNLNVGTPSTTAEMTLFGEGASGNLSYTVKPVFSNLARQIGGVRFWMGAQHAGAFLVDDIIVSYRDP